MALRIRKPTTKQKQMLAECKKGSHPGNYIKKGWNRKGREFRECDLCNAFLGFTGRKR